MTREQRLLARLRKHEKAVEEAKAKLIEAQKGFLTELGWTESADTGGAVWFRPNSVESADFNHALHAAILEAGK
jgi:hypothetical protein